MPRLRLLALGLTLLGLLACKGEHAVTDLRPRGPIILISIDTLRADRLPMYGYDKVATPHLDALRGDSILFANAYSHVPLTLPSHASILTGLLPPGHGVRSNIGYRLNAETPSIPALLKAAGYATGGAISSYVLRGSTGMAGAFDFYDDAISNRSGVAIGNLQRAGNVTSAIAKKWIEQQEPRPFFFLLHLFEPHAPYSAPEPFRSKYASAPYDGEIAATDALVGDFLAFLKARGIYDRATIIFLSDHGEGLRQHGEPEHGIFLYRETIHVPLLVKLPGRERAGETVTAPVGLVDVLPTVTELTGVEPPTNLDGRSLLDPADPQRTIYGETLYPRIHLGWSELRSLQGSRFHFIQAPRAELYDSAADPGETRNVLADQRRVYSAMRTELERYGSDISMPVNVDPEEAKKLAALGYLGSVSSTPAGPLPDPKDRIGDIAAMSQATGLLDAGRLDEAIAIYRRIVTENPGFSDAWNHLATSLSRAGRYEEAAAAYRTAIQRSPSLATEFALSLASVLVHLGDYDDAAKHVALADKTNPGAAQVMYARIAIARKDPRGAETHARQAQSDPGQALTAAVLLAQALADQNRPAEALALLAQTEQRARTEGALPLESLDSVRGDALARMERFDEATTAFRRSITDFPHDPSAYMRLAIVFAVRGQPAESRAILDEMVRRNPTAEARKLAAKTLNELGVEP
jgi:arylsulfatase A-like enzyme/tetratricopeptide (TPR) repeat protein